MSPRELRNQIDFFRRSVFVLLIKIGFVLEKLPLRTFPFGSLLAPPVPALSSTNLYCSYSVIQFIFIVNRWFRRMTSKSIFCQIFIQVKFSLPSSFLISRPPSNFYICQILKPATNQLHQLGLSNFKPATKSATNKIWHTISLYLYFPFYYNTNFKINQATKAVKFSRANLKHFKLWFLIKIKLYYI